MKTWLHRHRKLFCIVIPQWLTCFFVMVVLSSNGLVSKEIITRHYPPDSIVIKLSQNSKIHRIKLYPNATNEVLFFMAEGEEGKRYQLFVFDMDGKLVKQAQVYNRETTVLRAFRKGHYLIEIFSNDERIESGSITVKAL